ncbi:aldehyde dehydrogenase (NADP(+)) [Deinococcus peraridilitoris]|uniref:NAD-dependent aldehyde dehydrogenase n=1 Tax=Deinococcus peraridilitoris (strain DSM 19664 / LMG 22246 / CIP 109416 / KR-200) TaxID=937777 RepID=L0A6K7_DEIPD|nr:aldehyde dehydrogenase (NADP(+)) [Deinococcus peraridilitoris]AFZ69481.1 NAD-dependent aldehyde dehydrogenase [Deinococcus peraridilitoris DSM 19664]
MTEQLQPVLINGAWRDATRPSASFTASNPTTGENLSDTYPVSEVEDVEAALQASWEAAELLRSLPAETRAAFLERYAERIEQYREDLAEVAELETGLPAKGRYMNTEIPRTVNQLRRAARAVRERTWTRPTIDTQHNLRAMFGPLHGVVVVFGPNNFPFAFNGVAGGDFAAAIAAGNPVIAKAHPAHPTTSRLLAGHALQAAVQTGFPAAAVQMLYHLPNELGVQLVSDRRVAAIGFTGSRGGGLALKAAADKAGKPFYAEMSSVNPVFVLPGALKARAEGIADEFFTSCTVGTGQFCTNPGLVIMIDGPEAQAFMREATQRFEAAPAGVLLTREAPRQLERGVAHLTAAGARVVTGGKSIEPGFRFENTLLSVSGAAFLKAPEELQTELFGPTSLLVLARDEQELWRAAEVLEGNLTGTIYSGDGDEPLYAQVAPKVRRKVGRLLNDKMPTGVAVSSAMNHGGPYPATSHPGFTSVGLPAAITRFAALYSFDNVRDHRLPPELQDANLLGIWRLVDDEWTRDALRPAQGAAM